MFRLDNNFFPRPVVNVDSGVALILLPLLIAGSVLMAVMMVLVKLAFRLSLWAIPMIYKGGYYILRKIYRTGNTIYIKRRGEKRGF